jgi:hypothetical protein
MFFQRSRRFFRRSIHVERKIASWVRSGFRSDRITAPRETNDLDALRARLEQANRRVTESERLVGGWRDVTESEQSAGRDVSVARDLLKTFQTGLEAALNDKEEAEKALAPRLLDLFEGVRGRLPAASISAHRRLLIHAGGCTLSYSRAASWAASAGSSRRM